MDIAIYALLVLIGFAVGYGFRGAIGKLFRTAGTDASNVSATAKLDALKAKTDVVKAAVDAHNDVVTDLHAAIADLDKQL
jgi:hypothetical protein